MQKIKVVFARKKRKRGKGFTGIKETKYMQGGGDGPTEPIVSKRGKGLK